MACLDVSQFHWETYTLGTSSLRFWQRQKRKIKNFPFLSPHPLDFSNGKVRLHVISKSRTSVYEWRHHNKKIPKPFFLITSSHKNPKRKKTEQSDDLIFVSRMRNAEACITENHHELARVKNQKKASERGKNGDFGVFFLVFIIKG